MAVGATKRAYELGECGLHDKIIVKWQTEEIPTTVGRAIFNAALEERHVFVNETLTQDRLFEIIESVHKTHGETEAAMLLERLTALGFHFATQMGGSARLSFLETDFDGSGVSDTARGAESQPQNQATMNPAKMLHFTPPNDGSHYPTTDPTLLLFRRR